MTKPLIMIVASNEMLIERLDSVLNKDYKLLITNSEEEMYNTYKKHEIEIDLVILENVAFNTPGCLLIKELKRIGYSPDFLLVTDSSVCVTPKRIL